jgi:peroxiredoxin
VGNSGKEDARAEAALASVGVKVDPAIVARGRQQLADAADAEKERAAAAVEAAKKPQFRESYLRTANGQTLPEVTVENADGKPVSLSSVTTGKVTVITVWSATQGPGEDAITFLNGYTKRYADQPFQILGLAAYGNRDGYLAWRAASAASVAFPIVYDPAGSGPRPDKDFNAMTDEEKKAFSAVQRAHMDKVVPMKLAGGMMAPLPHTIVIDAQGRVVGFCVGTGPRIKESLGNLLLRAGITLAAEDQPTRVFTREESKDAPPPPRREMLKVGATAPDFTTQDLAGKDVRLSDFKGKVVILDFWATWCGPCMAAMPHTQKVAAQYKDQGVVVLGSCTSDTRGAFERWVRANQAKYPDILWSHDKAERGDKNISRTLYGVGGIPCQFVIDREGKIVEIVTGYMEGEVILDAALAKAGVNVAPEIVAKGAEDLKRRAAMRGN